MKKMNPYMKRVRRNRVKLKKVGLDRVRITVFKSSRNISAQIIDDKINKTIVSASSTEKNMKKDKKKKTDLSIEIGEILAKRAAQKKINKVYFDRGGYKYHGRIKALAESLRKNGLSFWWEKKVNI